MSRIPLVHTHPDRLYLYPSKNELLHDVVELGGFEDGEVTEVVVEPGPLCLASPHEETGQEEGEDVGPEVAHGSVGQDFEGDDVAQLERVEPEVGLVQILVVSIKEKKRETEKEHKKKRKKEKEKERKKKRQKEKN